MIFSNYLLIILLIHKSFILKILLLIIIEDFRKFIEKVKFIIKDLLVKILESIRNKEQ